MDLPSPGTSFPVPASNDSLLTDITTYRAAFAAKNLGSALRQLSKVRPMPRKPGAGPVPADQVIQVHYADEFENML